ncbi:MAG: SMP-30/gluconolactonase/LRE family protein [Kofleriaceae bacterium]|jgi:DNA-binding beta-propeller fold protein YncE|nr:SMP-30/gluconolactonase/LRE family protein [Kofleriaceae bacterium]
MRDTCWTLVAVVVAGCGGGGGGTPSDGPTRVDAARIDAAGPDVDGPVVDADPGLDAAVDAAPPVDAMVDAMPSPCALAPLGLGVKTLAGCAEAGNSNGAREVARFTNPVNVAALADGAIVVADFDLDRLRRVLPDGTTSNLTVQAGFIRPFGLAVTATGVLYVQTDANPQGLRNATTGTIWQVDPSSGVATALIQDIGRPRGMVALADGRLVLADYLHHVISVFDPAAPAGSNLTVVAGAADQAGHVDDTGAAARFNRPYGLAVLPDGAVAVADYENHRIRRLDLGTGAVTTLAGDGMVGADDGDVATASFNHPQDLAVDGTGRLYVADTDNYRVRRISAGQVSAVLGDGTAGYHDDDVHGSAQLFGLEGIDYSAFDGKLYLADGNRGEVTNLHNRIRVSTIP